MLEGMISATEHKAEDGNKHYTAEFETTNNSGDTTMNDIAGLLALMQGARLARENEALKDTLRGDRIADAAVSRLERFAVNHYTPTRTAASTPAA